MPTEPISGSVKVTLGSAPGQRPVVGRSDGLAEEVGSRDLGLVHRDVRERPDTGHIPDGPDARRGTAHVVDRDRARLVVEADRSHVERREIGPPSRADEKALALHRLARGELETYRPGTGMRRAHLCPADDTNAVGLERLGQELAGLGLLEREEVRAHLDDGHRAAETGEDLAELDPDGTASEHDERRGHLGRLDRLAVGPVGHLGEPGDGWRPRLGAGVDHDSPGRLELAVGDGDPPAAAQPAPAPHEAAAFGLETLDGDTVVPVVGRLGADPSRHRRPVGDDARAPGDPGHAAGVGEEPGGPEHHLRGDAAVVGALPAEKAALDAHDVEAPLG
jgi:hypothetical protein